MLPLLRSIICGGGYLYVKRGEMWVLHINVVDLVDIIRIIKMSSFFRMCGLLDIICIDRDGRYELIYILVSYLYGKRINLKIVVSYSGVVPSVIAVFKSGNWLEREVWDMFGLFISGHNDLRRILTDYGFEGSPLRKDFPVVGYYEVRYDEAEKRVVLENVSVMQELRVFEFIRAWH